MRYLFLAEKPSAMRTIKAAYESSNKPLGDIDFFALAGHICRLCEPKEYEKWNTKWANRDLPMIPDTFKVGELTQNKIKELKEKLKNTKYDAIIVGTDSDVEGNGIYDLIETYLGLQDYKTYRFFETDLTPAGIMKSMNDLKDYHTNPRDVGMTKAFRVRSRFDWLVGFNMTVAYTVKAGFLMKVGRVKAPTLKLVYDNCKAIDSFSSNTSYQPGIIVTDKDIQALMIDDDDKPKAFDSKEKAETLLATLSGTAEVVSYEKNIKKTQPEQLYKLTDIQYEAGKKYGYTPEKTLELIQSLYETHKLISYPRTDGRYVSSEKAKEFPKLLNSVLKIPELKEFSDMVNAQSISAAQNNKRYVNDAEVQKTSHDALIPTGYTESFNRINADEKNICLMIFKRFLAIFMEPLSEEKTKVVFSDSGNKFVYNASKVISPGFTKLFQVPRDSDMPDLQKGQKFTEKQKIVHEIVTKPPARFTQASLIKAMENVQKYMDAGVLKDTMKKAGGIGQPSSRAAIISELVSAGYMEDVTKGKGKGLHITDAGKKYIENLGSSSIVNPELSAQWEVYMNEVKDGTMSFEDVYKKITEYIYDALDELKGMKLSKTVSTKERKVIGKCPKCGKDVVEMKNGYVCVGYPDCNFSIFKQIAGKNISEKNVRDLLNNKITDTISGFHSKAGKEFSAALMLDAENRVTWAPFEMKTDLKCPKCNKQLTKTSLSYKCEDEKCGFILWTNICGKNLTTTQVTKLLTGKATGVINGFKKKDGTLFNASLVIEDGKLVWEKNKPKETNLKCPKCGSQIVKNGKMYSCKCGFHVWEELPGGVILTQKDIGDLVSKKRTKVKEGIAGKNGTFNACIVLKDDYTTGFEIQK